MINIFFFNGYKDYVYCKAKIKADRLKIIDKINAKTLLLETFLQIFSIY